MWRRRIATSKRARRPARQCCCPEEITMSKLRVQSFAISIDGFGAGPDQDLEHPIGVRGMELMEWFFPTRVWRQMQGEEGGETGVDNHIAEQGFANIGAWIL